MDKLLNLILAELRLMNDMKLLEYKSRAVYTGCAPEKELFNIAFEHTEKHRKTR